jgi:hypothetical protein
VDDGGRWWKMVEDVDTSQRRSASMTIDGEENGEEQLRRTRRSIEEHRGESMRQSLLDLDCRRRPSRARAASTVSGQLRIAIGI